MLKRSLVAQKATSIFFRFRNDLDIYTEDDIKEKEFYKELFNRLLNDKYKVNDITPLGCKNNVIECCRNDNDDSRCKIYIVDGDLDLITDSNPKRIKNLCVLDVYCIENYLIDETGVGHLLHLLLNVNAKESKKRLQYNMWLRYHKDILIKLYIHYAIMKQWQIKYSIEPIGNLFLFSKKINSVVLNLKKVRGIINQLKKKILETKSLKEYKNVLILLYKRWKITEINLITVVSGKDYLLPLLEHKIHSISPIYSPFKKGQQLKLLLAQHISLKRMSKIKKAVDKQYLEFQSTNQ